MAHTNETAHYHLPQYVGTDIINPLDDTNHAYEDIDTALYEQGEAIAAVGDRTTDIENELNASGGISDQVQNLNSSVTAVNDKADANAANITALQTGLSQTNTTVSGIRTDVNSLSSTVSGHTTSINSINSSISAINTKNTQQDTSISNLQSADTALGNRVTALENAPGPTVDTAMSGTSANAVQNKVIKTYVDNADTALGTRITNNTNAINNKNNLKLYSDATKQIRFGIDGSGNYGYYKDGADSVTPFKTGGDILPFTFYLNETIGTNCTLLIDMSKVRDMGATKIVGKIISGSDNQDRLRVGFADDFYDGSSWWKKDCFYIQHGVTGDTAEYNIETSDFNYRFLAMIQVGQHGHREVVLE